MAGGLANSLSQLELGARGDGWFRFVPASRWVPSRFKRILGGDTIFFDGRPASICASPLADALAEWVKLYGGGRTVEEVYGVERVWGLASLDEESEPINPLSADQRLLLARMQAEMIGNGAAAISDIG